MSKLDRMRDELKKRKRPAPSEQFADAVTRYAVADDDPTRLTIHWDRPIGALRMTVAQCEEMITAIRKGVDYIKGKR